MRVTFVLVALAIMATAQCATQRRSLSEEFDTTQTISLSGRVATLLQQSDHTYALVDVQTAAGKSERWAVRGRAVAELKWPPRNPPLKPGDSVTVVAYLAKPGADLMAAIPADHARLAEITKAGRLVRGIEFTLASGGTLAFGEP